MDKIPVYDEDEPIEPTVKQLYETQVKKWRRTSAILLVLLISLIGFVLIIGLTILDLTKDTNHVVDILERATGEDSQKQQAAVVEGLVIKIDCNFRQVIQELLVQLDQSGELSVLSENCTPIKG